MPSSRNYGPGMRIIVNQLCRYLLRHRARFEQTMTDLGFSDAQKLAMNTFFTAANDACTILNIFFPEGES